MSDIAPDAICVDVKTAAHRLGVSEWTIRAWCASGALPVVRYPSLDGTTRNRRILVRVVDLEAFAERCVEKVS